jgi:uncharacterized membrane-anchored protein
MKMYKIRVLPGDTVTIELAYQSLEENYTSNNKDFSADVRNALIGAGLSNEDIGQILYQIEVSYQY